MPQPCPPYPLLCPELWLLGVKPALTIHPGICTQGANAGRGLGGVANGLAGGPSVKVDVDRHGGAGEHQEPDDGQDVGNAHKLQGAGQTRAEPWLPSGQGHGQGSARFPRQGRARGRWGTVMLPAPSSQTQRVPRQAAQDSSPSWGLLQLTGAVPVPDSCRAVCVHGGDQQQQDGCHVWGGVTVARAKQGLVSAGGQLQKLLWHVSVALLPSLHGATPNSPQGNHSRAPLLSQVTGSLCQHFVEVPKPSGVHDPRGSRCHRAASTAGML